MEVMVLQGFEYPRHPPSTLRPGSTVRRLVAIVESIRFARSQLTPSDRALWVDLCKAEAKVRTLLLAQRSAEQVEGDGPAWFQPESGPSSL